tara:strand:+ start:8825 stop:9109 length:285 start_codon:yes stop_codon:yes gene_type:complete
MKTILKLASAAVLTLSFASGALAVEYTKGVVKKIDAEAKKVTLIHEELKNLGMPAMTMVFRIKDETLLAKLKQGANVEFVADRVEGKLTVIELK